MLEPIRRKATILFFRPTEQCKLRRRRGDLASCQVSLNSVQGFQRSRKCLSQSETRAAVVFQIGPKNTNLVEYVKILLPVKYWCIPFSDSEEKSKMSQPIRGQDSHLFFFSVFPKTNNFVEDVEIGSCQVSLNSIQWFQRRSRKFLSQSEARLVIMFSQRPEKLNLGRGH